MLFAILVLATALFIEGIGTFISILGLSALFAGSPVVITMAVALDIGKVVAVSFVYKNWAKISWLMKLYMTIATVVLMTITSAGVFGYLSGEFQKAIAGNNQQNVIIAALEEEKTRLQTRKQEIDAQIANLPKNFVNSRVRLMNQFKEETTRINDRLAKIDEELPKLRVDVIGQNVKIGPIIYVAEAFKTTPEQAVKWVILTIIFVFDPLAIALLVAGNFLLAQRKPKEEKLQRMLDEVKPEHMGEIHPVKVEPEPEVVPRQEAIVPAPAPAPAPEPTPPPAPEPIAEVAEEPKTPEKDEQEVITLKQIKQSTPAPAPRSSLEDIDAARGDVLIDGHLSTSSPHLKGVYNESGASNTVVVGGPSGRKR